MSDIDLHALARDVQYLKDRLAILDCISAHARGHDRHDSDLLTGAYHEDGVDEHGPVLNLGPKYAAWANAAHAERFSLHTHNITTHTCEIDGDVAYAESYVIACLLTPDETTAIYVSARYVDQLEKRDGVWRILIRRTINDVMMSGDASLLKNEGFRGYPKGLWSKDDLSYHRPLVAQSPTEVW
ncbi:MAG: nuclear transport factor 2 family protein [Caulobacterales bacterium]